MPPPRSAKKLCGSSLLISERRPAPTTGSPRSPRRPSAASRRWLRAARAAAPASCRRCARALARNASRSALMASLADLQPRRRGGLARRRGMRSRTAAVMSGSVAFGSPRMPTCGRIALADLPRVGVEMDELHAGRHRLDLRRQRPGEQVAADREQQIVLVEHLAHAVLRARHRAAVERMRGRERGGVRHELGVDRRADQLRRAPQAPCGRGSAPRRRRP